MDGAAGESIRRLAERTMSAPPEGAVVLAEVRRQPIAAVAIADGHTIANPARATPALLQRLRPHRQMIRIIGAIWAV